MDKKIVLCLSLLTVMVAASTVFTTEVHAKSIVSSYSDGYDAGKAAARAGQPEVCPDMGTSYCTGFHVGWNAAKLGQHLEAP